MIRLQGRSWIGAAVAALLGVSTTAGAATLDLTTPGASGAIGGAIFRQGAVPPPTSGVIKPFLRLRAAGDGELGFNSGRRDPEGAAVLARPLALGEVPVVAIAGGRYRQFLLDVDEPDGPGQSRLTLADLKVFLADRPDLSTADALGTPLYELNAGPSDDNAIRLDARLRAGLGKGDMIVAIPEARFRGRPGRYVYLYASFREAAGGPEEWAVARPNRDPVPEPSSMILTLLGIGCAGGLHFRRRLRSRLEADAAAPRQA